MMVYSTQNYWVLGLRLSSSILETRKRNVSETGSVSILEWERKTPTQLGPSERANLNHWTTCQIHYSYLITWNQANLVTDNKKICNKNCDSTRMRGTRIEKEAEI
jgi:hypothetical protein